MNKLNFLIKNLERSHFYFKFIGVIDKKWVLFHHDINNPNNVAVAHTECKKDGISNYRSGTSINNNKLYVCFSCRINIPEDVIFAVELLNF